MSTVAEQDKPKVNSRWKSLFVADDEEGSPAKPAPTVPVVGLPVAGLPVPAAIPGRPLRAVPVQSFLDQGMVDRILAELATSAPEGYNDFVGSLATLADALPTDDLLYKSALKLAGKQGHTVAGLALDYEKCLRLLDEQGRIFATSVQEQITAKVGGRQAEVARLDGEIAKLNEQLTQLQGQRDSEASAVETDTARIETTKLKFQGAFEAVLAQLNDQKNKLAAYGGKVTP